MKDNIVSVNLWGREIAKLEWRGGYKQKFGKLGSVISFHPDYTSYGWDLDPIGPYNHSIYLVQRGLSDWCRAKEHEGLPRFLSGALPDDWGNAVFSAWAESRKIRHSDITSVDKLAFIGKRGMGALEFVPALYDGMAPDNALMLEELYDLSRQIQKSREGVSLDLGSSPGLGDLMSVGMSAGGMHPKAIIAIDWSTGEVRSGQFLLPEAFTQYILKFRDSDFWPTAEVELAYHKMAVRCGIKMENCRMLGIEGRNHFLTERFDRKDGAKVHTATLQALNGETVEYEQIMRACRKLRLPYLDMEQVFRRAVFNYLSGVCDDHDKNFSFTLTPDGIWRLAPAYDVTFTVNLQNRFIGDRHVMSLSGQNRRVTRDDILRFAEQGDIKNASSILEEIKDAIGLFETIATELGIEKPVRNLILSHIRSHAC
ncbi:MAG: type II toxin-antitoxin system HipA family toxin [Bacteroidales bacterium]|nr:type II toxin-antitoxin system HipA family toxin [Bacteroidales bacterium]